jgi:hypothetical protein
MRRRKRRRYFSLPAVSFPSKRILPAVGVSMRSMRRIREVFPLPLGPIRVKISPLRIVRSI